MNKKAFPEWLITLLVLCVAFTAALIIRIALPYPSVFAGQWIKLTGIDAYYYMRLVDNLVYNFPQLISFDPYAVFPGGAPVSGVPMFFAYLMATIIKLLGGATPPQQTLDTIAVYIPPVLGALSIIPVYFIGKALVNRWAGIIAILLIAVMPGEFLSRSLLGYTDHHVAEEFFTSFFTMFFILAIKNGRQFTYDMLKNRRFTSISRHIPYSIAAGIFLGLYLITWQGALLFIFIVFIYFVIQFISDHLHGFPTDYLSKIAIITFLISILIFVPVSRDKATLMALAALILVPIALNIISVFMSAREIKPVYFVAVVAGLGAVGAVVTMTALPFIAGPLRGFLVPLFSWNMQQNVVGEMKPLFFPGGFFTLEAAWQQYAVALYSGLAGLALIIYHSIRKGEPEKIFVATWSLIIMLASFSMIRYASYFAVCLSVLTGYLCGWIIEVFSAPGEPAQVEKISKKARKRLTTATSTKSKTALAAVLSSILAIAVLVPGSVNAISLASGSGHTPSDAWMEALEWLKKNTPEPMGTPDSYYSLYNAPESGASFNYPPTTYSINVWNDYGYWITRIGRRIPVASPGTGNRGDATYFTGTDDYFAAKWMQKWGARYVVVDGRIASPNDKFYALANLTGQKESDFYELCWYQKDGKYEPLLVFYPDFYRSMVIRLYNFDGKQVVPSQTPVMTYEERQTAQGNFREIIDIKNFDSYEAAQTYIASRKSGNYRIVGTNPVTSPVPLEELPDYKLVYSSKQGSQTGTAALSSVKIFEFDRAIPVAGDWNGDKKWEIGLWLPAGGYFLLDINGDGQWNPAKGDLKLSSFGYMTDIPICGDWDGTGKHRTGFFRPNDGCVYLDINGNGKWDTAVDKKEGPLGQWYYDLITGDWYGNGKYTPGTYYHHGNYIYFGVKQDIVYNTAQISRKLDPVKGQNNSLLSGDWDGDGKSEVALWESEARTLTQYTGANWDKKTELGPLNITPDTLISGDWTGKGKSSIGIWNPRDRCFYLDINGDGKWNTDDGDVKLGPFGE